MSENILVVAAHPDDEVLGCGGTIARHAENGDRVHILIVAEGLTSRQEERCRSAMGIQLSDLKSAAWKAKEILGAADVELLDYPDNRLDSVDRLDLIKSIEQRVALFQPETVYLHHSGDVNIDHRIVHDAVITACRPTPGHSVKRLLSFEAVSSTEWQPPTSAPIFQPNWFVDISLYWQSKKEALQAYSTEMREWPHPRSIKALHHLAQWRGAQVGCDAAEAFHLLRNIDRDETLSD